MQKKFITFVAIATTTTIVTCIYWSFREELGKTVFVLSKNHKLGTNTNTYLDKDLPLQPDRNICKSQPFLVLIVTSYVGHVELRSAHRRAMPSELLAAFNATRIFLLARISQQEKYITEVAIEDESEKFGDILQGSFIEHYRNLTLKHLMGLRWASEICVNASFILKVDDDTVFNFKKTYEFLNQLRNIDEDTFLMGYILNNTKPRRNKQNKWFVTWDEYTKKEYPPYLSGWYYITTPKVAVRITQVAANQPYFWIDDIFVTGTLSEVLGIRLTQLPKDYWLEYYELLECCLRDMIKRNVMCDFVVGPNGGRNNLIVEFVQAIDHCNYSKNCGARQDDDSLHNKCIAFNERDLFSNGKAEIQFIKL